VCPRIIERELPAQRAQYNDAHHIPEQVRDGTPTYANPPSNAPRIPPAPDAAAFDVHL
jgi:hypothetical protein